jgi:hypothetical protein
MKTMTRIHTIAAPRRRKASALALQPRQSNKRRRVVVRLVVWIAVV